jgi:hypothetical protein
VVIGIIVGIYAMRYHLGRNSQAHIASNAQYVASAVNAIQIQIANFGYAFIATALTGKSTHVDVVCDSSKLAR